MKSRSTKLMAVLMVSLMAVVALAPLAGEETDAAVGDGGTYSYTLTYHADQMANTAAQETQLTVDGMTPISHASGTTTLSSLANEGSWGFNTTTGIGPFNSFYAAFDATDNNKFVSILDPYDLTKKIDGTALDDITKYNIMWVLPTVYWSVDQSGNLTLTNDPNSNGIAYAHTVNGKVREYLAYGVYRGYTTGYGDTAVMYSRSGVQPSNPNSTDWVIGANNNTFDSSLSPEGVDSYGMIWNFYQLQLYRYVCLTVMEGFDAQSIVGSGYSSSSRPSGFLNGQLNSYGPYAGKVDSSFTNSYVKIFIENPWGPQSTMIGGSRYSSTTLSVDTKPTPSNNGVNIDQISYTAPTTGFNKTISTDVRTWGLGTGDADGTNAIGTTDYAYTGTGNIWYGSFATTGGSAVPSGGMGLNAISYGSAASGYADSRLMFVYGDIISPTVTFEADPEDYGTVSTESIKIDKGTTITASSNTITLGTSPDATVITATPTASDAQYTYAFDSWTGVPAGGTVTEDLTITANFTRTVNEYTITWVIGESSETTSVAYGSTPTHADPTPPEGYYFVGWDPEIVPVTAAATYTAVFSNLTVTFDPGNGTLSGPTTKNVTLGQPIGELPTPTPNKTTYNFIGWFTSATGGTQVTEDTVVTQDASFTLYAQYELDDSLKPVKAMTDLIPLIFVVGIILLMLGTGLYYYRP